MSAEKCPFCKTVGRLAVFSVFRQAPKAQVQCLVCRAAGPEGDNPDEAWTRWHWAWQEPEPEPEPASTTAAKVAAGWPKTTGLELLEKADHRLDIIEGHLAVMEKRTHRTSDHMEAIDRRLDDMQGQMDRIVAAVELPDLDKAIARAVHRLEEKQSLFSAEEKVDPDNWLANHPRIRELSDEVDQLRKELYVQTGQTPGD